MRKIAQECWVQFATKSFGPISPGIVLKIREEWRKNSNQIKSDEFRNHPADISAPDVGTRLVPEIQFDNKFSLDNNSRIMVRHESHCFRLVLFFSVVGAHHNFLSRFPIS